MTNVVIQLDDTASTSCTHAPRRRRRRCRAGCTYMNYSGTIRAQWGSALMPVG